MVGVVVPAAGRGARFGSSTNKIWTCALGRPLIEWAVGAFDRHPAVDHIVVAGARSELSDLHATLRQFTRVREIVEGGATRAESVANGLRALPADCEIVLVHDAARPAVSPALIDRVVEGVRRHGAALPGVRITDTVKEADPEGRVLRTVPRESLWTVQTPQGARRADLLAAYAQLGDQVGAATDEAAILEAAGFSVHIVEGDLENLKVTVPGDVARAEAALLAASGSVTRTGIGYDVHPFAPGRALWLGGVQIPHDCGLAGHSDADALLHAICDALLGAAGMGDIGALFPDTDRRHKDRPSIEFVQEVGARLGAAGYRIVNIDAVVLAEAPRVGPHRSAMAERIGEALDVPASCINIKATTSEGMGFVGRREGIACWATASIVGPRPSPHP